MTFVRDFFLVLAKDLRLEARRLDGLASMIFLAAVAAMVLALALGAQGELAPAVGPGVLWVATLLAATVGLGRVLDRERRFEGFKGLLLTPMSRTAIFLGKAAAFMILLLLTEAALVPLVVLLFRVPLSWEIAPWLALLLTLGNAGFALIGMLLGAIALRARTGELLLGAVMYPLVVPLLIGGVKGTAALLESGGGDELLLRPWIGLLLLTDALFLVAGLWLFETLTSE